MNVHHVMRHAQAEADRASGAQEAWARCWEELRRMIYADNVEVQCVLESVPEPSNAERATWPAATKNYVEMLESLADSCIANDSELRKERM